MTGQKIQQAAELFRKSGSILFITGAGLSADSGLPTYRGIGGLYEDTMTEDGIPIEMALAGEMLSSNPKVTWKYLAQIEKNCREAKNNPGHDFIVQFENEFPRVWILTQNIDGFHSLAGSRNVIEIHGNIHKLLCLSCGERKTVRDFQEITIPPQCPSCSGIMRPDVVFFGEMLPSEKLLLYEEQLAEGFDLYVWIGTTCVFPYIQRPIFDAKTNGASTLEINLGLTEISSLVDIKLDMKAAEALQSIRKALE